MSIQTKGVWANASVSMQDIVFSYSDQSVKELEVDILVFIAIDEPPENGLDGILGLAVSKFNEISFIQTLSQKYEIQSNGAVYEEFEFKGADDDFEKTTGMLTIKSEETTSDTTMTYGGQLVMSD